MNQIFPLGTATGRGWQYCIELDGQLSSWVDWDESLTLSKEPSGADLRLGVTYYLRARNIYLEEDLPGSLTDPLAEAFQLTSTGLPVAVDADGNANTGPATGTDSNYYNTLVPKGNCVGPYWQYQLGRMNSDGTLTYSDWRSWSSTLEFSEDPGGGYLRTGVIYCFFSRSLQIPNQEPGSLSRPYVTVFQLLSTSEVLGGSTENGLGSTVTASVLENLTPDQKNAMLIDLLTSMGVTGKNTLCNAVMSCAIGNEPTDTDEDTDTPTPVSHDPVFDQFVHYLPVPEPISTTNTTNPGGHDYQGSFESQNCSQITGWAADKASPNTPTFVVVKRDGVEYGRVTCTLPRDDVKAALINQYNVQGVTSNIFGFKFDKNGSSDGQTHVWRVYVGDSDVQCYNWVENSLVCGTVSPPNTPQLVSLEIGVPTAINLGGDTIDAILYEHFNNGTQRLYASDTPPTYSVQGSPAGIVLTPFENGRKVHIQATSQATVNSFMLNASASGISANPRTIQVVTSGCTRPASGLTSYKAAYNFVPQGGYAQQFTTLADANTIVGKKFDGTGPGTLNTYDLQLASLNIGEDAYLGLDTSCNKAPDGIYPLLDSFGGNTVRVAILVIGGKISDRQQSGYTTSGCTSHPMLTVAQRDALNIVVIYEYFNPNAPSGGLSYTVRGFNTRQEAMQYIPLYGTNTPASQQRANYDRCYCTSQNPGVGDTLYNSNNPAYIQQNVNTQYALEAGYYGMNLTQPSGNLPGSYTLIQLNACGDIIAKESIPIYTQ